MNRRRLLQAAAALCLLPVIGRAQIDQADRLRISNYLNGITTMQGRFVQIGPDGDLSAGAFHMRRPGRIRFEYMPPNPTLIIADGFWIGVYDTLGGTLDRFPLSETPLDLLLRSRVDLSLEGPIRSIERTANRLRARAVDPNAPDQGSITMIFDNDPLELLQWIVTDGQGLDTTVTLSDIRRDVALDPNLFVIKDPA